MATSLIIDPGFYLKITPAQYFSEPCPEPALTNSFIRMQSNDGAPPAKIKHFHPGLGDNEFGKKSAALRMGGLVHRLALDKGDDYAISPFPEYRTNEAKEWKKSTEESGKVPIKPSEYDDAKLMADRFKAAIKEAVSGHGYHTEVVIAWKESVDLEDGARTEIWCRAMLDVWCPELGLALDIKTCASASDEALQKWFYASYAIQDAWYLRGLQMIHGANSSFEFIFQEKSEPFLLRTASSTNTYRDGVWSSIEKAKVQFATCLRRNEWPGYQPYEAHPTMWQMAHLNDLDDQIEV